MMILLWKQDSTDREKRSEKMYKALQILVERKYEVFMNLILFRNTIAKFWNKGMNNEVLVSIVRAGMVLVNKRIWTDCISARDSGLVPVGAVVDRPTSGKPIPGADLKL